MNVNDYMKKFSMPMDARSRRGIYSRGRNIYNGIRMSPNTPDLAKVAMRRLKKR